MFLGTIPLPVDQVRETCATSPRLEKVTDCVGGCSINDPGGRRGSGRMLKRACPDQLDLGWIHMEQGRRRQTATGLMTLDMEKGPMNREANFLDWTLSGRSRVGSQTFCPRM